MEVCQKNGQSLGEADECGKSLTHFKVCQSVSEVPSPAVYGPLLLSAFQRCVPLFKQKVERNVPRVYRGVEADVPLVPLFERSSGTWTRAIFFFGRFPLVYEWKQASDLRRRNIGYCVNRVNAV